jgi:hypothetical protein
MVIKAFAKFGIDAWFNEKTEEIEFLQKINSWKQSVSKKEIAHLLFELNKKNVDLFSFSALFRSTFVTIW